MKSNTLRALLLIGVIVVIALGVFVKEGLITSVCSSATTYQQCLAKDQLNSQDACYWCSNANNGTGGCFDPDAEDVLCPGNCLTADCQRPTASGPQPSAPQSPGLSPSGTPPPPSSGTPPPSSGTPPGQHGDPVGILLLPQHSSYKNVCFCDEKTN